MRGDDVLDELKKKGIISDEGVIDSYRLCKHAEKLLKNYGFTFIFDDEEDGFWITGVKE